MLAISGRMTVKLAPVSRARFVSRIMPLLVKMTGRMIVGWFGLSG